MHVCIRTQIATDIDTVVTILIVESGEMSQNGQRIVHCASTDLCCACVRMVGVCAWVWERSWENVSCVKHKQTQTSATDNVSQTHVPKLEWETDNLPRETQTSGTDTVLQTNVSQTHVPKLKWETGNMPWQTQTLGTDKSCTDKYFTDNCFTDIPQLTQMCCMWLCAQIDVGRGHWCIDSWVQHIGVLGTYAYKSCAVGLCVCVCVDVFIWVCCVRTRVPC